MVGLVTKPQGQWVAYARDLKDVLVEVGSGHRLYFTRKVEVDSYQYTIFSGFLRIIKNN